MRNLAGSVFLISALIPGLAAAQPAEEDSDEAGEEAEGVSYGAELDVASRYIDHGIAESERPVFQPSAHVSYQGATLTAWSSIFMGSEPEMTSRLGEAKLVAEYEVELGKLSLTPELTGEMVPDEPSTAEFALTASYDLGPVAVQVKPEVDLAEAAGAWYAELGVARSHKFAQHWELEGSAAVAWCSGKFVHHHIDEAMNNGHVGAAIVESALSYEASKSVSIKLHGMFSRMLDGEMRTAMGGDENLFSLGLAVGFNR
jgi:hypothetical protein